MVYDFKYALLYQQPEFVAVLLGLCVPLALLACLIGIIDYLRKNLENNPIKIAFYSVLFLQSTCRILLVIWVYLGHSSNMLYFDLPSLLFLSLASLIVVQIDRLFPNSEASRRRRLILIICNLVVCLADFAYYVFSTGMPPWQTMILMSYLEAGALITIFIILVWSFRCHWVNCKFLGELKLAGAFVCCGVCLLVRAAVSLTGIYTEFSPHERPGDGDDSSSFHPHEPLAPAFIFYGVGESAFNYLSLFIQYIIPHIVRSSDSLTVPLLSSVSSMEKGKAKTSELVEDYYTVTEVKPDKGVAVLSTPDGAEPREAAHQVQVLKFMNLFEKSLNSTNVILHEVLGKGGSGAIVYRCTLREGPFSGGTFAVKVMKDCVPADFDALMNEVRIYQSLKHNHIVKFMGADLSSPSREVRLFMEYIPHTLDVYINKRTTYQFQYFSMPQITKYMLQLVSGLQALHERNVIHRDLKTSNIFVVLSGMGDISELKIGDFDVSTFLKRDRPEGYFTANKGTDSFRAPEMVSSSLAKVKYDAKVDIWSMGMVLYSFLTLLEPYENESRFERGWDTPPTLPEVVRGNPKLAPLIHIFELCASPKPAARPSCSDIASLLQDALVSSTSSSTYV